MVDAPAIVETERAVRWSGGRICARDIGLATAPALVFLHGVGSSAASWGDELASLAARGYRVVAWDAPGYGNSDPLPMPAPTGADYATALAALLDSLGIDRFALVAHSLGVLIAAAFCVSNAGARVTKLILASPTPGFGNAGPDMRRVKVDGRLADMDRLGPAGLAQQNPLAILAPGASADAQARVRAVIRTLRPEGYKQAVRMLGGEDLMATGPRIAQETLVLSGSADTVTPEAGCRRIAGSIPHARYQVLPGLGHACYVEDTAAFEAAIVGFLA